MKKLVFLALLMSFLTMTHQNFAQETAPRNIFNFGVGMGIDYGGFGGRLTCNLLPHFAFFGALGYNLLGVGYNAGATFRVLPYKIVTPTLSVMYGYNGVIKISGTDQYNQIYYGPSLSAGIELNSRKKPGNHFNLELVLPFRPQEFYDDYDRIKKNPNIKLYNEPWPVTFSLGYHFGL
jgi:hypothetical protein